MDSIIYVYQLTTTLITVYGYWKIASTGYDNYKKVKTLADIMKRLINKLQHILDKIPNDKEKQMRENLIQKIADEISKLPQEFCSEELKLKWCILYKKDIENQLKLKEPSSTISYFPDLNKYVYIQNVEDTIDIKID